MEIVFNQQVYPSGTVEIVVGIMQWLQSEFSICKLRSTYKFKYSTKYFTISPEQMTVLVDSDLVENPKNLDICDWQLLKILHPQVQEYQWKIFQYLKSFVDNRAEEDYSLQRIKEILQKENNHVS